MTVACLPTGGSKASENKAEVPKSDAGTKEKMAEGAPSVGGDSEKLVEGAQAPATGSPPVTEVMDTQEVKGGEKRSPAHFSYSRLSFFPSS